MTQIIDSYRRKHTKELQMVTRQAGTTVGYGFDKQEKKGGPAKASGASLSSMSSLSSVASMASMDGLDTDPFPSKPATA